MAYNNKYNCLIFMLGPAHSSCNLQLKDRRFLTVIFHNLSSFDSKLIISGCSKAGITDIQVVSKTSEKFMCITINKKLRIIDSLCHMPQSLSTLTETLKCDFKKFRCTKQILPGLSDEMYKLLISKQVFPYEYVTPENLDEISESLPPIELFFSSLRNETVSADDYKVGCEMYKLFGCKTLRDFLRLYNKLDIGLLADVFQEHRFNCLDIYKADPLNYLSLSSFSFHTALSSSKQTLEYIRDINLFQLVKESQRGGVVNVTHRNIKSNIKGSSEYDPALPESVILQLDHNSLYSHGFEQFLPVGNYKKLVSSEIKNLDLNNIELNGKFGYLFRIDVHIPIELHDYLAELPPLPEKITIEKSSASPFQQNALDQNTNTPNAFNKEQYLCTLFDKKDYVCYFPTVRTILSLGLVITKIHEVWKYDQSPYLNTWCAGNISRRSAAKDPCVKQAIKNNLNNAYGHLGIDPTKFKDVFLVSDHLRAERLIKSNFFKSFMTVNESLCLVEMKRRRVCINNHLIVSSFILDFARSHFYDTFYAMKSKLGSRMQLAYCDTDSYLIKITTQDYLSDLASIKLRDKPIMDFSYLPDSEEFKAYKSDEYNKKPGKLQSETGEFIIQEAVILQKKFYACKIHGAGKEKLRAKGIPKAFLKNYNFDVYKRSLVNQEKVMIKISCLRSLNLQIYNLTQERMFYNPIFASRYLCNDGVSTLPWGHKDTLCVPCDDDGEVETLESVLFREF
jgi:hypothetical protein